MDRDAVPQVSTYTDFFDNGLLDLIPLRKGSKLPVGRWTEVRAARREVEQWQAAGNNLGLRTARFPCVDIDVTDPALAEQVTDVVVSALGATPIRRAEGAKRALLYRTAEAFRKRVVYFDSPDGASHKVEVLAGGQYVAVAGTHPSGKPYVWDQPPHAQRLPWVTEAEMDGMLADVAAMLDAAGCANIRQTATTASTDAPAQESLVAELDEVTNALRALPNDFPDRETYLNVAVALKAALRDHPVEAEALWQEWCARWSAGVNDPTVVARDWESLHPPYRLGAPYLFDLARAYGDWSNAADVFPALEEAAPPADPDRPTEALADDGTARFSDAWIAGRFIATYGERVRACDRLGGWLSWDGARWAPDEMQTAHNLMSKITRHAGRIALSTIANPKEAEATARYCHGLRAVRSSLAYAAFDPRVVTPLSAFDADPWLLNTPGGVVDLRTGAMAPTNPALLCTKVAGVTPDATLATPRWSAFLAEATGGDRELEAYLHRLVGYALTGSTREHILAFFWGPGGNGKGVFLNTIVRALGSYAAVSAMDTFVASKNDRHPTELAALAGARLVTAQETQEGRSWDEAKVKSITGGDPITARFMGKDFFTYDPQFTLFFAGNHKPHISNLDDAMRRRFHLVPFTATPKRVDPELAEALTAELPGILAWAVRGCLAWQAEGLVPPLAVRAATEQYFADEDPMGRWLGERTVPTVDTTATKTLYDDWCRWCAEQGERPGTLRAFSTTLRNRGVEMSRTSTARGFTLGLRASSGRTAPAMPVIELPDDLDDTEMLWH